MPVVDTRLGAQSTMARTQSTIGIRLVSLGMFYFLSKIYLVNSTINLKYNIPFTHFAFSLSVFSHLCFFFFFPLICFFAYSLFCLFAFSLIRFFTYSLFHLFAFSLIRFFAYSLFRLFAFSLIRFFPFLFTFSIVYLFN
jgi:hypothetical protein